MVASIPAKASEHSAMYELPLPDRLPNGVEPEARIVVGGISWESYLEFDQRLGDDRPGPRFYYHEGELEIMTTSREHERIREWIGGLLDLFFDAEGIESYPYGQATMRLPLKAAGAEPDKSWCIGSDKRVPDIVLEIALTSGGLPKLKLYERFKVPEVWLWRENKLEIYVLKADAQYQQEGESRLLRKLDVGLLERCLAIRSWPEARRAFRAGLSSRG